MSTLANFVTTLRERMDKQIETLEQTGQSPLAILKQSIEIVESGTEELRLFLVRYDFSSTEEEIDYFKNAYPAILSRLLYYMAVFNTKMGKPAGGASVLKKYYAQKLKMINDYFVEQDDFYRYYRSGADFFDVHYFTRTNSDNLIFKEEYTFAIDTRCCTTHSYKLAKVLAFKQFERYILEQQQMLEQGAAVMQAGGRNFKWTGSKVALTELVYGLIYSGNINNGVLQIKDFFAFVENAFDIKLGNYSRTKQEIYSRKNDRSYFDTLKKRFQQGMEDADDRYN